ncbi:MAG: general secretion pathway protein GspK [Candidatus Hydrogenedentes bacterium]|nr:general secretion pathway protein GspK [Candidatus Hydrogenedentota bacterium]
MRARERGYVLITVLWALVVLTALMVGFGRRAMLDQRAAAYSIDHTEAYYRARGAIEMGIAKVKNEVFMQQLYNSVGLEYNLNLRLRKSDLMEDKGVYAPEDPSLYGDDQAGYELEDAEARISLNASQKEIFEQIEGLGFTTIEDILERQKSKETPDKYNPFLTVEEARYLKGMTDELWEGSEGSKGLRDLFTVYGDGRININTAADEVLKVIPDMSDDIRNAIIGYRQGPDGLIDTADDRTFRTMGELAARLSLTGDQITPFQKYCKLRSQVFKIKGFATERQGKIRATAEAVVEIKQDEVTFLNWMEGGIGS